MGIPEKYLGQLELAVYSLSFIKPKSVVAYYIKN